MDSLFLNYAILPFLLDGCDIKGKFYRSLQKGVDLISRNAGLLFSNLFKSFVVSIKIKHTKVLEVKKK